jgi:hypothetical protein
LFIAELLDAVIRHSVIPPSPGVSWFTLGTTLD